MGAKLKKKIKVFLAYLNTTFYETFFKFEL